MNAPTTHFATRPQYVAAGKSRGSVPLISATTMAGVPALIRDVFGDRILAKANREVMLDIELIEDKDCFIPQATMTAFTESIARQAGEAELGLLFAPYLDVADYGRWGHYMLGAATLEPAIRRAIATLDHHSRSDRMSLAVMNGVARFAYLSAARPLDGYRHIAQSTVGAMLCLCRSYLGVDWRPLGVEFDLPRPRRATGFEDVFGCEVIFDAPSLVIRLPARGLRARRRTPNATPLTTLEDLARTRRAPSGGDRMLGSITEHVWSQVLSGSASIESTARALGSSVRTLQRELNREGVAYRALVTAARSQRAMELLCGTDTSVTSIAMQLGYSSPAHFSRAFRTATGRSPSKYRRSADA